jgi:hypothetical protein
MRTKTAFHELVGVCSESFESLFRNHDGRRIERLGAGCGV